MTERKSDMPVVHSSLHHFTKVAAAFHRCFGDGQRATMSIIHPKHLSSSAAAEVAGSSNRNSKRTTVASVWKEARPHHTHHSDGENSSGVSNVPLPAGTTPHTYVGYAVRRKRSNVGKHGNRVFGKRDVFALKDLLPEHYNHGKLHTPANRRCNPRHRILMVNNTTKKRYPESWNALTSAMKRRAASVARHHEDGPATAPSRLRRRYGAGSSSAPVPDWRGGQASSFL
nr:unnamed protein product [Rangifer tarandus platyrhynchus]